MIHELKCWPTPFAAVTSGAKTFEVRRDDREPRYAVGDWLQLREFNPQTSTYTGKHHAMVVYKVEGGSFGLPADLCVLGLVSP